MALFFSFHCKAEHSLELHTPFIARVMHGRAFKLVPIVVGSLTTDRYVCDGVGPLSAVEVHGFTMIQA